MLGVEKMDAIYEGYLDKDEVQIGDITIPLNEGLIDSINMNGFHSFFPYIKYIPPQIATTCTNRPEKILTSHFFFVILNLYLIKQTDFDVLRVEGL